MQWVEELYRGCGRAARSFAPCRAAGLLVVRVHGCNGAGAGEYRDGGEGPGRSGALAEVATMQEVRHISVSIARRPADVYAFAADPKHLPLWAAGLARSEVKPDGDYWVADAPFGRVRIRFAARNPLGVLDHDVELASGVTIHNPMRVMPNGEGSEFLFTLVRQPGMSDEQFADDAAAVSADLHRLKELLEASRDRES